MKGINLGALFTEGTELNLEPVKAMGGEFYQRITIEGRHKCVASINTIPNGFSFVKIDPELAVLGKESFNQQVFLLSDQTTLNELITIKEAIIHESRN